MEEKGLGQGYWYVGERTKPPSTVGVGKRGQ